MADLSIARGPDGPPLLDLTIGGLLHRAAAAVPDRLALVAGTADPALRRSWTYAGLLHESEACAHALLTRFKPGERVAVWAHNIPEWVVLEFGAALAGVVLVTVNPALRAGEVEYILTQSKAAGLFVVPAYRGNPVRETALALQPRCPSLRHVIGFDGWAAFIAEGAAHTAPLPAVQPGDAAMIQYTSGTTGFPKGALLHHRGLVNNAVLVLDRMGLPEAPVWIGTMPLFHTGGCGLAVLGVVSAMGTQVLVEAYDPALVLALTHAYRAHVMVGVPTMLIANLEHPDFAHTDFSRLAGLCCGGATVPPALVRRLEERTGAPFTIVYGQTECSPVATMTFPDDSIDDKALTIGRALAHVAMKVADPLDGRPLPVGELGELCTRGFHVMRGYFEMPEATAAAIDADGWLHTGDIARMDADGYFYIVDRKKDLIIASGYNIVPREVEEVLFMHPKVMEAAVVGVPDAKRGETVKAFVVLRAGETADADEIRAFCKERLAPYKVPTLVEFVKELPKTQVGKVLRRVLAEEEARKALAAQAG